MIQPTRVEHLNDLEPRPGGRFVLYWMQQSQRAVCNHALEYAVQAANGLNLPLAVVFGLTADYPEANLRHYVFMLEGVRDAARRLTARGIKFVLRRGSLPGTALEAGRGAAVIVCDRGYLRHQRQWRRLVAREAGCRVVQVESDLIVPVRVASDKAEYAARTIRPKIQRHLDTYLQPLAERKLRRPSLHLELAGLDPEDVDGLLRPLAVDRGVGAVSPGLRGGTEKALARFGAFLRDSLSRYRAHHNQPQTDDASLMSPYLHFGQVSALDLALRLRAAADRDDGNAAAFLEELVVRRELAANYVFFAPAYDRYEGLPAWARKTLGEHSRDPRVPLYDPARLEAADTHDPYWNAAMTEMRATGFMHGYMRMYWAKKILEWSPSPEEAFALALALNNKYFLDGRDPNSCTGVAWSFGLHDRPWKERPIFGKVRFMAASGLERKCGIRAYVEKVAARTAATG